MEYRGEVRRGKLYAGERKGGPKICDDEMLTSDAHITSIVRGENEYCLCGGGTMQQCMHC